MKILKKVLLVIVILIALVSLVSLFLPRHVSVQRSQIMKAPTDVIFTQVNELKSWTKWSPWFRLDPAMQLSYSAQGSGVGASYSWKSSNSRVGNGTVTIVALAPSDSLTTKIEFEGRGTSFATYKFSKEGEGTRVTWTMHSDLGMNPIAKFFGLAMDKMVGPDFEKGLHNLDSVAQVEVMTSAKMMAKPDSVPAPAPAPEEPKKAGTN